MVTHLEVTRGHYWVGVSGSFEESENTNLGGHGMGRGSGKRCGRGMKATNIQRMKSLKKL